MGDATRAMPSRLGLSIGFTLIVGGPFRNERVHCCATWDLEVVLIRARNINTTIYIYGLVHVAESFSVNRKRPLSLLHGSEGRKSQKRKTLRHASLCCVLIIKIPENPHSECGSCWRRILVA